MNQLFSNRTPHQQQQDGSSNIGQLLSLLKTTSPEQAKSQVEQLTAAGNNVSQAYDALITVPRGGSTVINVRAITATSIRIANVLVVKVA